MITENLSTLKIHKLTQAQYDRELDAGNLDENALYLTPYEAQNETDGLPSVTSDNNGAFLRVVDGVWTTVQLTDVSIEGA